MESGEDGAFLEVVLGGVDGDLGGGKFWNGLVGGHVDSEHDIITGATYLFAMTNNIQKSLQIRQPHILMSQIILPSNKLPPKHRSQLLTTNH